MNKVAKIFSYIAFVFAFCFMAIGYAAVQDELLVNGTISVDGYIIKSDLSAADTEGYIYDADTKTIEIKDIYYNSDDGKNYKVTGIAENGFSSTKIAAIKETNNDFALDATTIEAFTLSEGVSQIGANAFNGLSNLKSFNTTKNNNIYFKFEDKILFKLENDEKRTLVYYSFDKEETYYVVDETTITAITDGAFSNNKSCTAILTSYYDDNAWGSPAAVMISTVGFLDSVEKVEGSVAAGFTVYLEKADEGEAVVLQGNDDPDSNFYGQPKNVMVAANDVGSYISIDKELCKPCDDHNHYSQIYLSSWQTLAYAYLTEENILQIHNCKTAIVGGEIYQWVSDDDDAHRVLPNSTLYNIPSGTVNGSNTLPTTFPVWTEKQAEVLKVEVVDAIAPTSVSGWFSSMEVCAEMDLAKLDTQYVTSMYQMFYHCYKLKSLDLSHFNTSSVESMNSMFMHCNALETLNISGFNTSNVTNMFAMFSYCRVLTSLDVSSFDTKNVTNMQSMFIECMALQSLDLINFNTSNVTNMSHMFQDAIRLSSLNVNNFNTAKVTTMYQMFTNCYALTSLNLSSFNTSKVTAMGEMFKSCNLLETITVSDKFVATQVTSSNSKDMFNGCTLLKGGNGTTLASVQATGVTEANSYRATYAKIDKEGQLGYFTAKTAD